MTDTCIGWDIGGAHVKAVLLNKDGLVEAAAQVYCPLWQGLSELESAIKQLSTEFNAHRHAVTMTGELADIFSNRREGVDKIATVLNTGLQGQVKYYAGRKGFVDSPAVLAHWSDIASMNWYASVECIAACRPNALLVDIGSTTTDIAPIKAGSPLVQGFTDAERMRCDELVYTGVVRTPLMAIAQKIQFAGQLTNVAAEHFATAADIYTLTGDLKPSMNSAATADGGDKTHAAAACRIARMIGCDAEDAPASVWIALAQSFKRAQLQQLETALLPKHALFNERNDVRLIGAGAGAFLVESMARELDVEYQHVAEFIHSINPDAGEIAAVCFPAYAVAWLTHHYPGVFV